MGACVVIGAYTYVSELSCSHGCLCSDWCLYVVGICVTTVSLLSV